MRLLVHGLELCLEGIIAPVWLKQNCAAIKHIKCSLGTCWAPGAGQSPENQLGNRLEPIPALLELTFQKRGNPKTYFGYKKGGPREEMGWSSVIGRTDLR